MGWIWRFGKGPTPVEGKWNNTDLKVIIQWFKRDGDKAMTKNKEGLLLQFQTHTHVIDDTSTYPHEEVDAAVALVISTLVTATCMTTAAVDHTTASNACSAPAPTWTSHSVRFPLTMIGHVQPPPTMTSIHLILLLLGIYLHHMLLLPIPRTIPQLARPLQPPSPQAPLLKLLVALLPMLLLHLHLLLTGMTMMPPLM
jgi:hypothetical protein